MDQSVGGRRASIGARRNPASEQAILDAAAEILTEEGLAGFSIEAVARRARAGKPTIYRWWPNRTILLLDVYHRFKRVLPDPDTGTLEGDARMFLTNLLTFWKDPTRGTVFRSIIAEAQSNAEAMTELQAYLEDRHTYLEGIIERARARGEVRDDVDSRTLGEWLVSFAWHRLLTDTIDTSPAEIETVVRTFAAGAAPHRK
ncbi:TetR/AcrR family transcriptional regulator [Pelagibacterium xiamenense]|uniref:TetR/AcrR family transcriptional regulator n=1 Tax=Pelagibacterium xiamenense TaxID=2901140 RepID=UPI001E5E7C30|nr:TetR/AcrR family transcriptional regulator [Pelagibacterium xiamenense]MCD7061255.1 TetR/AcrR family transcriptional regulator [Pelagibacterium xiamenense]